MSKLKRTFTAEFKRDAIALAEESTKKSGVRPRYSEPVIDAPALAESLDTTYEGALAIRH